VKAVAILGFVVLGFVASSVFASAALAQSRLDLSLMKLEPNTRMVQVCDLSGLKAMARAIKGAHPDGVRINALSEPNVTGNIVTGNIVTGSGGAMRAGGRWINFSFSCALTPDRMKATAFSFAIGREIPQAQWEKYNLWR
jgi:Domain of Unknown Function (DUF930)